MDSVSATTANATEGPQGWDFAVEFQAALGEAHQPYAALLDLCCHHVFMSQRCCCPARLLCPRVRQPDREQWSEKGLCVCRYSALVDGRMPQQFLVRRCVDAPEAERYCQRRVTARSEELYEVEVGTALKGRAFGAAFGRRSVALDA